MPDMRYTSCGKGLMRKAQFIYKSE
ncbi:hypothetical protein ECOLI_p10049 [Escherichia coli]|nr:hypothetical protein ECOLI_p10049 [Escherichia coli]